MKIRTLMIASALALVAGQALAADAPSPSAPAGAPMLVRGTIASIDAKSVTITKADGTSVTAMVAPKTGFAAVEPRRFDQIKPTDFVGITAVPGPNDTLQAEEVHIIPAHVGEGSYPWDHHPDAGMKGAGSMTNGTVATVHTGADRAGSMTNGTVTTSKDWSLKVTYKGSQVVNGKCVGMAAMAGATPCTGVASVTVLPNTPIVAIVPASPADAKPGLAVFASLVKAPDGMMAAASLVMEKNGIKPVF